MVASAGCACMEPFQRIDEASPETARGLLRSCCGSTRWVERMLALRPFGTTASMLSAARREWFALTRADWTEAFSHHPKIGDRESLRARFPATHQLSEREQAGMRAASDQTIDALAHGNAAYERRFGYIFIVCATGKSAGEMLDLLTARLQNDPVIEERIAAEELAKITELRLKQFN
jgi:2-oxo-4-hydroxy-4-carboxy-5-ureidoimidazoline decarboxylase